MDSLLTAVVSGTGGGSGGNSKQQGQKMLEFDDS